MGVNSDVKEFSSGVKLIKGYGGELIPMQFLKGLCVGVSIFNLLMPTTAKAEDWKLLDDLINPVAVDVDSIETDGSIKTYWKASQWVRHKKDWDVVMEQESVDCDTRRTELIRTVIISGSKVVHDGEFPSYLRISGTAIEGHDSGKILSFVCQY